MEIIGRENVHSFLKNFNFFGTIFWVRTFTKRIFFSRSKKFCRFSISCLVFFIKLKSDKWLLFCSKWKSLTILEKKNELLPNFIRQNLENQCFHLFWKISNFWLEPPRQYVVVWICERANFFRDCNTFRLEQNKSHLTLLRLIKNIKHQVEIRQKNFPLSREDNSFSKSPYSKNCTEKIEIFPKFCFFRIILNFFASTELLSNIMINR